MANKIRDLVKNIIDDIERKGDSAISKYIYNIDFKRITPKEFLIKKSEIDSAIKKVDKKFVSAVRKIAENIRMYHEQELKHAAKSWSFNKGKTKLGQIIRPVDRVGVYVPGGRYSYPSTILMAAIPAKVAGVNEVVIVTPPKNITPEVLYTAWYAGVDKIYRVGGPMAVAALAFGTETIPKVDLIVGPGNLYVTEAKRQLYGVVGIDMIAGPSEVAVLCDKYASPEYVANDLLAQVEHGKNSRGYLFSMDSNLINEVKKHIPAQYRSRIKLLKCKSLAECIESIPAHPAQIVPAQVHQHNMFRPFFMRFQ